MHFGATSQDINDTVTALQLQECKATLLGATRDVRRELTRLADKYAALASIGRTHGQHAIPITMGFKVRAGGGLLGCRRCGNDRGDGRAACCRCNVAGAYGSCLACWGAAACNASAAARPDPGHPVPLLQGPPVFGPTAHL